MGIEEPIAAGDFCDAGFPGGFGTEAVYIIHI